MGKDINLDGVEVSILKALGFGGGDTAGSVLLSRLEHLELAEIISSLDGLMNVGYVSSDRVAYRNREDFEKNSFSINSGYARELKDALDPNSREKPKSRRVRRE